MEIRFHGAAGTVTGSCYEVVTTDLRLLVDCGMFQGNMEELNRRTFPFEPSDLDYVLLTHAHIDHSGLLPRLVKEGFGGTIICTSATLDLCRVMLPDSGHIQEAEAEWRKRKGPRQGLPPFEPLYNEKDAQNCLPLFRAVSYDEDVELSDSTTVRLSDAGHILGSAFIQMVVDENGETSTLTFSGDLGNVGQPIIRDPARSASADVLLVESTYGDSDHENIGHRAETLASIIRETLSHDGNVIVPSFAIGRTQDVIYEIVKLMREGKVPPTPIFVDSPLATSATAIYNSHRECFDPETLALLSQNPELLHGREVRFVRDAEESKSLNNAKGAIVISASGMCEVGRILHHLRHNLWRPEATILFVGYQAEGTLGRCLLRGVPEVHIFGEAVQVRARIEAIGSFSAHADQTGLMNWIGAIPAVGTVLLIHGEAKAQSVLKSLVEERLKTRVEVPNIGSVANVRGGAVSLKLGAGMATGGVQAHGELARTLAAVSSRAGELSTRLSEGHASETEVEEARRLTAHARA